MDSKRENTILIDWLSITSKIHSPEEIKSLLGMEDCSWETVRGEKGYQLREYYEHISIHYEGRADMGVWLEMSGQGCRAFESYGHGDYNILFDLILNNDYINITRLDIAFDEYEDILDLEKLCEHTRKGNYRSKMEYFETRYSSNGMSVDIGSPRSDTLIRIYDKLAERLSNIKNKEDKEKIADEIPHWTRVELQLRDDRAKEFVRLLNDGTKDIGIAFTGVLRNYLEYGYYRTDEESGKQTFSLYSYWEKVVGSAEKLSVWNKPGVEYNLENLTNLVINQIGNANDAFIKIKGVDAFVKELKARTVQPNPKYQRLINKYGTYEKPTPKPKIPKGTLDDLLNGEDEENK